MKDSQADHRLERVAGTLRRVFGLKSLRPGQGAVIERVLRGRSTLAIMPTGSGKSLCYQLPAVLLPGITVVVSPLIALMKDQCEKLLDIGVRAAALNSSLEAEAAAAAEAAVAEGSARVVFVTPERFCDGDFTSRLLQGRQVSLVVVDEAHCISQWGHDFRPAFLEIGPAIRKLGSPTVLALTATAPEGVAAEIMEQLDIGQGGVVHTGIWRPNLRYSVQLPTDAGDKLRCLSERLQSWPGCGIVYAATVRAAEEVHAHLCAMGIEAGLYHGKQRAAVRHASQEAFMRGETRVMVATNAFGMGIDKEDVRFVLHYQLPPSLEAYYQESGRAGRDGLPADCVLLYLRSDRAVQQFLNAGRPISRRDLELVQDALSERDAATTAQLHERTGLARGRLASILALLQQERLARKTVRARVAGWLRTAGAARARSLDQIVQHDAQRRDEQDAKLKAAVAYAEGGRCRWSVLTEQLQGAASTQGCGTCDNCLRVRALAQVDGSIVADLSASPEGPAALALPPSAPARLAC